jgi:four helix bundle protein
MKQFDHEKLNVYTASLDFVRFVHYLVNEIEAQHRNAKDQLTRASQSIPLNIAEGNAKVPGRDRTRFWEIARGSAMESAAALDILVVCGACEADRTLAGKDLLFRIVSMLSKMTASRLDAVKEDVDEYTVREQ